MLQKLLRSEYIISFILFFTAFVPRVLDLGRFLTPDEFLWIDRSKNFLAGLLNPAYQCVSDVAAWNFMAEGLACTLRTGHPGVTTMWTGSFGFWFSWLPRRFSGSLFDYVAGISTNPLDAFIIVPERLGTVLVTSLWVVAVYGLVRRLLGPRIALVGALLIALNPFHVALSRVIHHDALSTTFITLSILTALIYWGERSGRSWLVASGLFFGLGFMSKSPALVLMPFVAVVGLWFLGRRWLDSRPSGRLTETAMPLRPALVTTILDGLLWFGVAIVTVFAVWPAMWVAPREALEMVFFIGSKYATGGHAKGNFFLGQVSSDPGALFYPVSWLFRTSPLVMLGLAVALIGWPWLGRTRQTDEATPSDVRRFYRYLPLILIFIAGYYLMMTIGEKKQDRYFLPVYPWIDLIAGVGLIALFDLGLRLVKSRQGLRFVWSALGPAMFVLLLNGWLVAGHYPYYFTYYNPLLGGAPAAAEVMTVGWGEGLDQVADYLNSSGVSPEARVASWYESTFAPYYLGRTISYSQEKGKVLAGDYAVFYINQTQRRFPDEILFEYIMEGTEPLTVVTLEGVEYAWLYPSLGVNHYVEDQTYSGIASLLAWQWTPDFTVFRSDSTVNFELYWEYLGKRADEPFFFRLVDAQERIWAEGRSRLAQDNPPVEQWREGEIIREVGQLDLPEDMPAGEYRLRIGLYTDAPAVRSGELLFTLPPDEAVVTVESDPSGYPPVVPAAGLRPEPLSNLLTLYDAAWPPEPLAAGETFPVELLWEVEQQLPAGSTLHVGLINEAGEPQQAWFNLTLSEIFNPTEVIWQPGDKIRTRWQLELLPDTPPGEYELELVLPDTPDVTLRFGQITVE